MNCKAEKVSFIVLQWDFLLHRKWFCNNFSKECHKILQNSFLMEQNFHQWHWQAVHGFLFLWQNGVVIAFRRFLLKSNWFSSFKKVQFNSKIHENVFSIWKLSLQLFTHCHTMKNWHRFYEKTSRAVNDKLIYPDWILWTVFYMYYICKCTYINIQQQLKWFHNLHL